MSKYAKFTTNCGIVFYANKEQVMIEALNEIARGNGYCGSIWVSCIKHDDIFYYSILSGIDKPRNIPLANARFWHGVGYEIQWYKAQSRSQLFDTRMAILNVTNKDGEFS